MTSPTKVKHTAIVTLISQGGILPGVITQEMVIGGIKKGDGPSYLDGLLQQAYQQHVEGLPDIEDCRTSVTSIYSTGAFFHYSCPVHVSAEGKPAFRDTVEVFIERASIVTEQLES